MNIGDTVKFKASLPDQIKGLGDSVAGECGTISAIETRDGEEYINVVFPAYGEVVGVKSDLFDIQAP